jgi:hypothetical protein
VLSGVPRFLHQRGHRLRREQGVAHATPPLGGLRPILVYHRFAAKLDLHIVGRSMLRQYN